MKATRMLTVFVRALRPVVAIGFLSIVEVGCNVGPDYDPPKAETGESFSQEGPQFDLRKEPASQWWLTLEDSALNHLVDEAVRANYDLKIALANLQEARELLLVERFSQFPIVTFAGGYDRQRLSKYDSVSPKRDRSYYTAGLDATWELDVFGGVRRAVESREAELGAAEATVRDARVSVIAEVARTYVELRGSQASYAIAESNAKNQLDTYDLTARLLVGGRGTELDTSRAKSQLETTRATVPVYRTNIRQAIYRLAVLTGRRPGELVAALEKAGKPAGLPDVVPIGDPIGLFRRRADIRGAERRLASATALIGVQTADLYPHLVFTGTVGVAATTPANLGRSADFFSFGPHLSWAAFDLGRVQARVRAAGSAAEAEAAAFHRTVLYALEEIEDALTAYSNERERMEHLAAASTAARKASELARQRYESGGVGDFLGVLDAERRTLEAEQAASDSRTKATTALIAVYKALGAGADDPLPEPVRPE